MKSGASSRLWCWVQLPVPVRGGRGGEVSVSPDLMLVSAALPCGNVCWQHLPVGDAAIGALAMARAFERREHCEWLGGAVAFVLVAMACRQRRFPGVAVSVVCGSLAAVSGPVQSIWLLRCRRGGWPGRARRVLAGQCGRATFPLLPLTDPHHAVAARPPGWPRSGCPFSLRRLRSRRPSPGYAPQAPCRPAVFRYGAERRALALLGAARSLVPLYGVLFLSRELSPSSRADRVGGAVQNQKR